MIDVDIDFASRLGDARNQGQRPTCLVFAASDLNAAAHDVGHLSTEFLCHHAALLSRDWQPECGFQMDEVLVAVAAPGQPLETSYPYMPNAPMTPQTAPTGKFVLHASQSIRSPNMQCDEILKRVLVGQPVGVVIRMAQSIYRPTEGVIAFDPFVIPDLYHAVVAVGAGRDSATGEPHLLVRNSWDKSWGINGHAWVSVSHLKLLLHEGFLI